MYLEPETVPPTNSSVLCEPPYSEGKVPLVLLYSIVLALGLPANMLTVYLTWMQVRRKNVLGVYLLSLSLCDLGYLCTLPLWALYVHRGHVWSWSSVACKLTGYIFFNNMYISIMLLCCVSCDRYVAVVYSVESRGLRGQRTACLICVSIVMLVACGHLPVFTMREGDAAANGERRCFEPSQRSAMVAGFNYARFLLGFLLPLSVLVASNLGVLASVRRSTGLRYEQKQRVRKLALGVVALFLVCFGPYHVILLIRAVMFHLPSMEQDCVFERRMYTPYTVSLALSTLNSAANPMLYVLSSDNIRKELRKLTQLPRLGAASTEPSHSNNKIQHVNNVSTEKKEGQGEV